MKERKVSFSAVLIVTILTTGAAQGGTIGSVPGVPTSLSAELKGIVETSPEKAGVVATGVGESPLALPAAAGDLDRAAEPASMGFLGFGISGIVALRRIRKLFF